MGIIISKIQRNTLLLAVIMAALFIGQAQAQMPPPPILYSPPLPAMPIPVWKPPLPNPVLERIGREMEAQIRETQARNEMRRQESIRQEALRQAEQDRRAEQRRHEEIMRKMSENYSPHPAEDVLMTGCHFHSVTCLEKLRGAR